MSAIRETNDMTRPAMSRRGEERTKLLAEGSNMKRHAIPMVARSCVRRMPYTLRIKATRIAASAFSK